MATNATENDIEINLTPQELITFDFCKFPGEKFSDSEEKNTQARSEKTYLDRVARVKNALYVSHLTPEERKVVYGWAEDYADIFHLNGEMLSCTHLIQHRIPTINEKVIHKKQYRSPNEAREHIDTQLKKQFDSGIIGHSNSPYNAPLLIVPKKLDASGEKKWRLVVD